MVLDDRVFGARGVRHVLGHTSPLRLLVDHPLPGTDQFCAGQLNAIQTMISSNELYRDYNYPWEYSNTPDTTPTLRQQLNGMSSRVRDVIDTHLDDAMENVQQLSTALVFVVLIGAGIKTTELSGSAFVALGTLATAVLGMKLIWKPRLETLADYRLQKK